LAIGLNSNDRGEVGRRGRVAIAATKPRAQKEENEAVAEGRTLGPATQEPAKFHLKVNYTIFSPELITVSFSLL